MKEFTQYQEIFDTQYDFSTQEIKQHIESLKHLDKILPPSTTFLMITNTLKGKYDFISKNFEFATGLNKDALLNEGIPSYLAMIHPEEIKIWLQVIKD